MTTTKQNVRFYEKFDFKAIKKIHVSEIDIFMWGHNSDLFQYNYETHLHSMKLFCEYLLNQYIKIHNNS